MKINQTANSACKTLNSGVIWHICHTFNNLRWTHMFHMCSHMIIRYYWICGICGKWHAAFTKDMASLNEPQERNRSDDWTANVGIPVKSAILCLPFYTTANKFLLWSFLHPINFPGQVNLVQREAVRVAASVATRATARNRRQQFLETLGAKTYTSSHRQLARLG